MPVDQLMMLMQDRINASRRTGNTAELLSSELKAMSADVWRQVQPVDPASPTKQELDTVAKARYILGFYHYRRYSALPRGKDQPEMIKALTYTMPLVGSRPQMIAEPLRDVLGPSAKPSNQVRVAAGLLNYTEATSEPAALDLGIAMLSLAIDGMAAEGDDLPRLLNNLGSAYYVRYQRAGSAADLDMSITHRERAQLLPADQDERNRILINLERSYRDRFELSGNPNDRQHADDSYAQAAAPLRGPLRWLAGTGRPRGGSRSTRKQKLAEYSAIAQVTQLEKLAGIEWKRYGRTGEVDAARLAVTLSRKAMSSSPRHHPAKLVTLINLGMRLLGLFECLGDVSVLNELVEVRQQAATLVTADDEHRARVLADLGVSLGLLFEYGGGDTSVLQEAINLGKEAVTLPGVAAHERAGYLSNLSNNMCRLFDRTGDLALLRDAIDSARESVVMPPSAQDRPAALTNLASALERLAEWTHDEAGLDEAIKLYRDALTGPHKSVANKVATLSNLASGLMTSFGFSGNFEYAQEAIGLKQQAIAATEPEAPAYRNHVAGMRDCLHLLYDYTGDLAYLEEAVDVAKQALILLFNLVAPACDPG